MKTKAFTLIELMTVVSVIVILAGIMVFGINDWKDSANIKGIVAHSNEVKNKLGSSLLSEWKMEGRDVTKIFDSGRFGITGTKASDGNISIETNCPEDSKCIRSNVAKIQFNKSVPILKFKTICFWIKSDNDSAEILHNPNDFKVYSNNGVINFDVYSADSSFVSVPFTGTTIKDNKWHFICGSINDNKDFYGMFDDEIKVKKAVNVTDFGRKPLTTMCLGCSTNSKFYIDDLSFYEEAIVR